MNKNLKTILIAAGCGAGIYGFAAAAQCFTTYAQIFNLLGTATGMLCVILTGITTNSNS